MKAQNLSDLIVCCASKTEHRILNGEQSTEGRVQSAVSKRRVQRTECRIQSAKYRVQRAEYKVQRAVYKVQKAEYREQRAE